MKALVTGASRGIGKAVALALHANGAQLVLSARDEKALAEVAAQCRGSVVMPCDLAVAAEVETLAQRAHAALSGLDTLVQCAGIVRYQPMLEVTSVELRAQLEVNFFAAFTLAQRTAQLMAAAGKGGAIVQIASTLAQKPAEQTAAYAASKAALVAMTRSFALELAPQKIRVNAVAPGLVDTDMIRAPRAGKTKPTQQQLLNLAALHPLGRLGTAAEVAEAVLYLVNAQFVTGEVLVVDGGLLLA